MRGRLLIYLIVLLLAFNLPPKTFSFAGELPQIAAMPALASTPALPSLQAFGTPKPPSILGDTGTNMPSIEFWEEKKNPPQPRMMPVDPSLAAALSWPVFGRISSGFGPRGDNRHDGIDIPVPNGTPIQAAASGVVVEARAFRGYGYTVILDHKNGMKTLYAHCSRLAVEKGESVENGQVIAYAGRTGRATSHHLHFGVIVNGAYQNPMAYLERPQQLARRP